MRWFIGLIGAWAATYALATAVPSTAAALSGERGYEVVSPSFKGGFGALDVEGVSPDGEGVVYYSPGSFANQPTGGGLLDYLADRRETGWSTAPLLPPASSMAFIGGKDISPSLDLELVLGKAGENSENQLPEELVTLHRTATPDLASEWETAAGLKASGDKLVAIGYQGAAPDFCRIVVSSEQAFLQGIAEAGTKLYLIDRGCEGKAASLALVGVNNKPQPAPINNDCYVDLGDQHYVPASLRSSAFNAIGEDGETVFFTECAGEAESTSSHQLYVRLGGSRTVEVSRPLDTSQSFGGCTSEGEPGEVPCEGAAERASADFAGASEDGTHVYFVTRAELSGDDTDAAQDVYMAVLGCPEGKPDCDVSEREVVSLSLVSRDPNGAPANVQGVVRVAPNGQRMFFVASGNLLDEAQVHDLESSGKPTPRVGADNLYVYDDASGSTEFVGDLCSGKELSGQAEDVSCPSATGTDTHLWSGELGEVQTAGSHGRFIVFATYAQLVADDTDSARDVYRYDTQTGSLERVSVGEDGYGANGNDSSLGASLAPGHYGGRVQFQYEMDNRAISEDGSRIVFTSSEPLSAAANNGLSNAYEWHETGTDEGNVSLISTGSSEQPVDDVVISSNSLSVFFITADGLVSTDTDGAPDVYDARLGSQGFPPPLAERRRCEGDACQGPLTNPAPLLMPDSEATTAGDRFKAKRNTKKRKTAKKRHKRRRHARAKQKKAKRVRHQGKAAVGRSVR